jgi:hypothetical protein
MSVVRVGMLADWWPARPDDWVLDVKSNIKFEVATFMYPEQGVTEVLLKPNEQGVRGLSFWTTSTGFHALHWYVRDPQFARRLGGIISVRDGSLLKEFRCTGQPNVVDLGRALGECASHGCWDDMATELRAAMAVPAGGGGVVLVSLCSGLCAAEAAVAASLTRSGTPVNAMVCFDPFAGPLQRRFALEALAPAVHVPLYVGSGRAYKNDVAKELRFWGPRVNAVFAVNKQIPPDDELSILRFLPANIPYVYTFNQASGVTGSTTAGEAAESLRLAGVKPWSDTPF